MHYFLKELKVIKNSKNFIIQPILQESFAYLSGNGGGRQWIKWWGIQWTVPSNSKSMLKIRQRVKVTTASWLLAGKRKSFVRTFSWIQWYALVGFVAPSRNTSVLSFNRCPSQEVPARMMGRKKPLTRKSQQD